RHRVVLLVDVTHPYAAQIKVHAQRASAAADIPLYRYARPEWPQGSQDRWHHCNSLDAIIESIGVYHRPFFTLGRSVQELLPSKQQAPYKGQHWTIRHIHAVDFKVPESHDDLTIIDAVGPFCLEAEIQILKKHRIDVIIAKNSGGEAVVSKVLAARHLHLPVVLLQRPVVPATKWQYEHLEALEKGLEKFVLGTSI
ncbi:MAG: precorrin-6A/cobalt-precorrin-6A reductase, partial [Thiohalomonadales bacterium]